MLHVHLLGAPYLLWDEEPLTIARRIPRAMLYYLAAEGRPISRSNLQDHFWPEVSDRVGRSRLRDNLAKLRNALPDPDSIETIGETVLLSPEKAWVDLLEFNDLLEDIGRLPWQLSASKPLPATTYHNLTKASKLWRGPGFLSGFNWPESPSLDNWQRTQEAKIQHHLLHILNRLIEHETAVGNLEQLIVWVLMALQLNNLDEDLHYLLLKTYLDLNRRSDARKHYYEIEALYLKEFSSELPEPIRLLKDRISDTQPIKKVGQPVGWSTHASVHTPFVGRSEIIDQIDKFCSTATGVVIFGEAGIGKTRLVQECYQRRETKPRLLMAAGHPTESNLPYYAWINLLRHSIRPEEWQRLSPSWAAPLAIILPELIEIHPDLQSQDLTRIDHPRTVLLDAVHQLLRMLASASPLVLFVDDVHWVDESSLAILSYLLQQSFFDSGHNFLMMTARTEEKNPWLDKLLINTPSQKLRQIELTSLEAEEVANLVQFVLVQSPPREFVERLNRDTGGNPLYLLETLQAMLEISDSRNIEEIMSIPLAPSVHQLIQARMQGLSDLALDILQATSLMRPEFNLSLVQQVTEADAVSALEALVELEVARFIQSSLQEYQPTYSFTHEKIRESILFELSPARKRLLHAKIASALEQYLGDRAIPQAASIAYHYQESGSLLKAFDFWVQAGLYAYRLFSTQEATDAFSNAERIIPREPGLSEGQIYRLYENWSEMAFEIDNQETLFRINETLLSLGQESNSDLLIGVAYDGLSDAYFASNQFEKGLAVVVKAIPYLQRTDNLYEQLISQLHQGAFLYMLGQFTEAREILYKTLEELPDELTLDFKKLNAYLHYQIGIMEVLMGYPVIGLGYLQRAIERRHSALPSPAVLNIYTAIGLANYIKGDFETGYLFSGKAIELGKKTEYWRMLGYAYAYSALNGNNLGLLDEAWEHANQALYIGQTYGHFEITALAYRNFGNTYLRLEDYQPAIAYLQKGIQISGEHYVALELMALLGYAQVLAGQVEEGLSSLNRAYQGSSQLKLGAISVYVHSLLLLVKSQQGVENGNLQEEINRALADSKDRSIRKATTLLNIPILRASEQTEAILEQMQENLQDASSMSDLLLEARILRDLITFKKNEKLPLQSEVERLNVILEELAPRAKGMPFKEAWKKYYDSMKSNGIA
ncbi:MAG: AAA family ATPase [Anaerolineales bacterium]